MRINSEAIMERRVIKARVFNGRLGTDRPDSRGPARVRSRAEPMDMAVVLEGELYRAKILRRDMFDNVDHSVTDNTRVSIGGEGRVWPESKLAEATVILGPKSQVGTRWKSSVTAR